MYIDIYLMYFTHVPLSVFDNKLLLSTLESLQYGVLHYSGKSAIRSVIPQFTTDHFASFPLKADMKLAQQYGYKQFVKVEQKLCSTLQTI